MDDQSRCFPFGDMVHRVPFFGIGPRCPWPAIIPLVEPQFFGFISHRTKVENTRMIDEAFETVGPVARNPVHHITAIGSTKRAGVCGIQLRVDFANGVHALLQIFKRPSAPVFVDAVGEFLTIARRPVKIDGDNGIALRCHDRRVPPVGPAVVKRSLWSAMHKQQHRQLARRILRLYDLAKYLVAIGAGKIEFLVVNGIERCQSVRIYVC